MARTHLVADEARIQPFWPDPAATVNIAAGVATANIQIQSTDNRPHVRVFNSGAVTAFIELGGSSVAATLTTSMPLGAGGTEILSGDFTYAAAITASSTATVYFTPGEGV